MLGRIRCPTWLNAAGKSLRRFVFCQKAVYRRWASFVHMRILGCKCARNQGLTILAHLNFSAVDETGGRSTLTYVRKFLSVFVEYMKK